MATRAILQDMTTEMTTPIAMVRNASPKMAIVSVVRPLSLVISSAKMLLRIPGALSFESNQANYLCRISVKSILLKVKVKFSPQ